MTIRTIIRYQTSDGKEFDDRDEAEIYDAYQKQMAQAEKDYFQKVAKFQQGKLANTLSTIWSEMK